MERARYTNLIKLSPRYYLNDSSAIALENGQIQVGKEQFIAVGLEKTRAAEHWEDRDYFKIVVVVQAIDGNYYISEIEHPADVLSPKQVEGDRGVFWVEETKSIDNLLIANLYTLDDCRDEYTLTIYDKPYLFYEKYIVYTISASYEIWENYDKTIEVSPFLKIRCQFSSRHPASELEDTPTNTLEYPIAINSLLQTSVFQHRPFKIWNGRVKTNGIKVTLESV